MPVLDAREHGKLIRQFLKAAREIQEIGLIGDIEHQTLSEIQSRLIKISSPGAGYKQTYPRHGSPWEEAEIQRLIELAGSDSFDVGKFASEYQRRPESVIKYMKKPGLTE
ncbi:hypothetical protein PW716_004820 [Salmonella enterica]|nr:hypothetical protein [Salmonella enterica]EKN2782157.1 hypothetical protein [Salmonella enterica]